MDLSDQNEFFRLKDHIALTDDEQLIAYLSVPPLSATQIVDFMGQVGLNSSNVKIMYEKPFGMDYNSAVDVIDRTERYFEDGQVYRIDHYLAKEMAQNIVAFRGGNALFSHIWNGGVIEKIEVLALEKIGIEGRAHFYEQTGALRDLVQGHLMQLLSLVLMHIPEDFEWSKLPDLRLAALEQVEVANPELAIRGQYNTYRDEVVNQTSLTETFVSLQLQSSAKEWQGVPLILTTGKGLNQKTTEIRVHLRKTHEAQSNCIRFKIQPDEGVEMEFFVKKPGYDREFERQQMKFSYPEDADLPDAYEQVIVDAIKSRKSLFTGSKEVLRSWEVLRLVQEEWQASGDSLRIYELGAQPEDIIGKNVH
jgi:glucose-6-phosphate 1-dehydrogenase